MIYIYTLCKKLLLFGVQFFNDTHRYSTNIDWHRIVTSCNLSSEVRRNGVRWIEMEDASNRTHAIPFHHDILLSSWLSLETARERYWGVDVLLREDPASILFHIVFFQASHCKQNKVTLTLTQKMNSCRMSSTHSSTRCLIWRSSPVHL